MARRVRLAAAVADLVLRALSAGPPLAPLIGPAAEAMRLLRRPRNVILYGAPGTGKTYAALQIRAHWERTSGPGSVFLTTFHPSYAYEDFVQGWRPNARNEFELVDGVLFEAAKQAERFARIDPNRGVLLVIDEINRANVARVFGELVTFVEHDKRNLPFTTALDRRRPRSLPPGLFVLGTMNTADKSISLLDVALRRRFSFVNCPPDPAAFAALGWVTNAHGVSLSDVLTQINNRLTQHKVDIDRQVGHAMLAVAPTDPAIDQTLTDALRYEILPLVEDYLFGDAPQVAEVLPGLADPVTGQSLMTNPAQLGAVVARLAQP